MLSFTRINSSYELSSHNVSQYAWSLEGNNLENSPYRNIIGTTSFHDFNMVSNNLLRGGFKDTGERFLTNANTLEQNQYKEKFVEVITTSIAPIQIFTFTPFNSTVTKFKIDVNFISTDMQEFGNFERNIILLKKNGILTIGRETNQFTDRSSKEIKCYFQIVQGEIRFYVVGKNTQINWTGYVSYFSATA